MALSDYEQHQLAWMIDHGYSLSDLVNEMGIDANGEDGYISVNEAFERFMAKGAQPSIEGKSIFNGPTEEHPLPLQWARRQAGFRTASDFADAVDIPEYPKYERELAVASPFDQIKIARELKSRGVDPSILDCPTVESVKRWEAAIDAEIDQLVKDGLGFPPCWGGMVRVNDKGDHITSEQFDSLFETEDEANLYYALTAADCGYVSYGEVVSRAGDSAYVGGVVNDALDCADFPMFYTEYYPTDFSEDELVDMVPDRPDLFGAEARESFPELQAAFDRYLKEQAAPGKRAEAAKAVAQTCSAADAKAAETQDATRAR